MEKSSSKRNRSYSKGESSSRGTYETFYGRRRSLPVPLLKNDNEFPTWKKDVKAWSRHSQDKGQGLALHLSLTGKAKSISDQISLDVLDSSQGVQILLEALDKVFLPGANQRKYIAYKRMKALNRKADESILDFICKFKSEYYRHRMEGMILDGPRVSKSNNGGFR